MPAEERTASGALLLPRPDRRRFALHAEPGAAPAAPAPASPPEPFQLGSRPPLPEEPAPGAAPPPSPPSPAPSRLEQLGLMTAGVAHDFNNVLSVIMVCAGEIAADAEHPQQAERAGEISEAARRGAELSRMLLTSDRLPEAAASIAIDAAIVDVLPIVRRTLGDGVELRLSSQGHLPHVVLAPGELERMLVNLAANARDAMPDGGAVAIHTAQVTIPVDDPFLGTGWCVRLSFSDSGTGMSPDIARRAVQPYFSTKPKRAGSGLGLATVHGLVRSRGGDLRISTAPGTGATISLYLPAVSADGEPLSLRRDELAGPG